MSEIKYILMKRDGISAAEADDIIEATKEEIDEALAVGDYDEVEDIMACNLGLEMDYIFELVG